MKVLFSFTLLFISFTAFAQYDSTKILQVQNSYGYSWKNGQYLGSLIIPKDTVKMAAKDSNAIAAKGAGMYKWNGYKWISITGTGGGGSTPTDTQYLRRDININTTNIVTNTNNIAANTTNIGLKVNIADTANMLAAYRSAINLKASQTALNDTAAALRNTTALSSVFAGGVISSIPAIGNNPGSNITTKDFIISQFYASQPPTAGLTGGGTYEITTVGSTSRTLSWTAGRQSATATLSTIIVDGVSQAFTQPALSASVSGTKLANVPNNANTTYTNTVTTTDGKTATATTTFSYQNKIYAGFVTSATPTDADIIAALNGNVGGVFSGSRNQSGSLSTPSASKFIVFANPASYGSPNVVINGLGVTYNQTTRSFTNASGGVVTYIIAVSPFSTAGQIDSYIIN